MLGRAEHLDLEEVVHHADALEPGLLGRDDDARQVVGEPGPPAGQVKSAMCRPIFTCCLLPTPALERSASSEPGTASLGVRVPPGGTLPVPRRLRPP